MVDTPYQPIDCDFHDLLEAAAVRATQVVIAYVDGTGTQVTMTARIVDLFSIGREEFLRLSSGADVRLDHIVSIDGQHLAGFGASGSHAS